MPRPRGPTAPCPAGTAGSAVAAAGRSSPGEVVPPGDVGKNPASGLGTESRAGDLRADQACSAAGRSRSGTLAADEVSLGNGDVRNKQGKQDTKVHLYGAFISPTTLNPRLHVVG